MEAIGIREKVMAEVKIGVVLAGAASKGVYELGVMRALEDYFGIESIRCVSSASIGALVAQTYGMGRSQDFVRIWTGLDKKHGSFFLAFSGKEEVLTQIDAVFAGDERLSYEHYVSVWNYTKHRVEYIPFHELSGQRLQQYIRGAIAIPFFSGGTRIDGDRILDGAFLDNIPAYPLVDKDLDFVFCVYFDNCNYVFESPDFDRKVIKLFDFPNSKRLELMNYDPKAFDSKAQYGYDYTMRTLKELFDGREPEQVYEAIAHMEQNRECTYKPRLTADIVLNNINVVTRKYAKRLSTREKKK